MRIAPPLHTMIYRVHSLAQHLLEVIRQRGEAKRGGSAGGPPPAADSLNATSAGSRGSRAASSSGSGSSSASSSSASSSSASSSSGARAASAASAQARTGQSLSSPAPRIERYLKAPRLIIDRVSPAVDNGRYPAKGVTGQAVIVEATIFGDGHNRLAAQVLWRRTGATRWRAVPLTLLGNDRWRGQFVPKATAPHEFVVEAWLDRWQNYHHELYQKAHAGVPVELEVREGELLLKQILDEHATRGRSDDDVDYSGLIDPSSARQRLHACLDALAATGDLARKVELLLAQDLATAVERIESRPFLARLATPYIIDVERERAGFASWYELFPRSVTDDPERHGTFDDVIERLPAIKQMGFDVLYFPPIHPIGQKFRKGKNNSVTAAEGDVGSPYAIGSEEGGHDTAYSKLGGISAFRRLVKAAESHGMEIALDFAIQCAPDHPWLKQHPDWFTWRPDGSIRYAENPPKKYQDIVNVDFYQPAAMPDMWLAWRDVILYWISEGVHIFRVDNPHTKPLPFWEWLISEVRERHPETLFLSEAFTRPAMMYQLAKIGFSQSYTYFIWRNDKAELTEYLTELAEAPPAAFFRPNFFVNTPDINPFFTQTSGRAGFLIRSALAATTSGLWGVYSGFELCEAAALPGKEEYLDSEKYEIRPRDYHAPGNIVSEITRLNHIRKENPALQTHLHIAFHDASNDQVLFFSKRAPGTDNLLLVAISLDPHQPQESILSLPLELLGAGPDASFEVQELMRDIGFTWRGRDHHWYFNPAELPFAIWRLQLRGK